MKKILIITLYSNNNFGNKLQNYALQEYITSLDSNVEVTTQRIKYEKATKNFVKKSIYKIYYLIKNCFRKTDNREKKFIEFNNYINYTNKFVSTNSNVKITGYDYYIYGSDQVWNPNGPGQYDLFLGMLSDNNISYAASLSAEEVPVSLKEKYKEALNRFKLISVREDKGKDIIEKLTERKDIELLIDPTMLLGYKDWEKIIKKPKGLKRNKYILNYFLGELSEDKKKVIDEFAEKNDCDVINILDKNDSLYDSGPAEFLYLEKNAFLICTDSFHSSVFAILFDRPFVIFKRKQSESMNMFSRIETLLNKFQIKNREYDGKSITKENLKHDYEKAYKILEEERKKSKEFLLKSLDLK